MRKKFAVPVADKHLQCAADGKRRHEIKHGENRSFVNYGQSNFSRVAAFNPAIRPKWMAIPWLRPGHMVV
jgi:hypothetical protein